MLRPRVSFLLFVLVAILATGTVAGLAAEKPRPEKPRTRPALQRTEPVRTTGPRRKAPKSLSYIYGDGTKGGTQGGGDSGTDPGGDGTGDAQASTAPDPGGVVGRDRTQQTTVVHESTTNTGNLDDGSGGAYGASHKEPSGVNDIGVCFCVEAPQSGWASLPGYGNDWDQRYRWSKPVANPAAPTTVQFRFPFNYDTEFGRDFFLVEVNRGGFWEELARYSGTNKNAQGVFDQPAIFDQTFVVQPFEYVGPNLNEVELRLRVITDGEGSDEDGLYPSQGAAQVDELKVWFDGVQVGFAPFDIPPFADGWQAETAPFAGDFTKLLKLTTDLDPCRENVTFQFAFVDDGTPPNNAPGQSTGGSTSPKWLYGPGGYVVNHSGGLTGGEIPVSNEWVTPAFAFDLPGPADDGKYGALLGFGIWKHLPLSNGIFYDWRVRSHQASTGDWGPWRDRGMAYYDPSAPHYERIEIDVSDLLENDPDSVQVALGMADLADAMGLPGTDATPAPMFDNIWFAKYPHPGPAIAVEDADRFQDAFPQSGSANFNGPAAALSVRLDVARDTNPFGVANLPGDSLVARVKAVTPGLGLQGAPVLKWALRGNSLFANARTLPPGTTTPTASSGKCENPTPLTVAYGVVTGQAVTTASGAIIADRYFFDLPDGTALPAANYQSNEPAMFFPGDEIHYFLEAVDSQGAVSTLPADTTGFFDFRSCSLYDRDFRVRALPSLRVDAGNGDVIGPKFLVIDESGDRRRQETLDHALLEAGLKPFADYDFYAVNAPSSGESNGIGSEKAHGANAGQLASYRVLLYDAGELADQLLSDGSGDALNDKGDDLGVLTSWHQLTGDRSAAHFGDNLVSGLINQSAAGGSYVQNVLAAQLVDDDVRDDVSGQLTPIVAPINGALPTFLAQFAVGGCLASDQFDAIEPLNVAAAHRSHEFLDPGGQAGVYSVAAGVWHGWNNGTGQVRDAVYPYSLSSILDLRKKGLAQRSARSVFLEELIVNLGSGVGAPTGGTPPSYEPYLGATVPNPFNPRTRIEYFLPAVAHVRIDVYDLAGRRVRRLLDAERGSGLQSVLWTGDDDHGQLVSSGVYLVQMKTAGRSWQRKVALVR